MLPVLWLSLTMLLFQNLNALYFFYPHRDNQINMHHVFWVMFGLMVAYAAIARPRPVEESAVVDPEPRFRWEGLDRRRGRLPGPGDLCRRLRQWSPHDDLGEHALAALDLDAGPLPARRGQAVRSPRCHVDQRRNE